MRQFQKLPVLVAGIIALVCGYCEVKGYDPGRAKLTHKKVRSTHYIGSKLMAAYPEFIVGYTREYIIWKDSTRMAFFESDGASTPDPIDHPALADQFAQKYVKGAATTAPGAGSDPGRVRYEPFFYKMYGSNEREVRKNLTEVTWCPKLVGQKVLVTRVNGIDKKIRSISKELDKHPEYKKYVSQIGGTFCWRNIAGSDRQSAHSFGMTIDLNTAASNYWQWDCHCTSESQALTYRNTIPQGIVDIFEKYGFIWGGKWYHYDTMHFEYRPELMD